MPEKKFLRQILPQKETRVSHIVLIVEDTTNWANTLGVFFRIANVSSVVARNYEDAIEILKRGEVDGLVTDGLNGKWEDLAVRANELGLPVFLVSGTEEYRIDADKMNVWSCDKGDSGAIDELVLKFQEACNQRNLHDNQK